MIEFRILYVSCFKKIYFLKYFQEIPDAIVLYLLHAILPPTICTSKLKNNRKITFKCTFADSQNSFLHILNQPFELDTSIQLLRERAAKEKQTIQPFLLAVGGDKDLFQIQEYFTFCDGILCKFTNIVAAVECCFKTFYVLNISYSKKCYNFWIFVQNIFFELEVDNIHTTSGMIQVLEDFKSFLN